MEIMEVHKSSWQNGRPETSVFEKTIPEKGAQKDNAVRLKAADLEGVAKEIRIRIKKRKGERGKDRGSFHVQFTKPLLQKDFDFLRKKVQARQTATNEDWNAEMPKKLSLAGENKRDPIKIVFKGRNEAWYAEIIYR